MSNASTPSNPFFRDPITPPRLFEQYTRSISPAPRPDPGPWETQGAFATPPPRRSRSPSILQGVPIGSAVEPPGACMSCHKSIAFPCAVYTMYSCPKCHQRIRNCYVCGGTGVKDPLGDRDAADCNACVGSGKMADCTFCNGTRRVPCGGCNGRGGDCRICSGARRHRCRQCNNQGMRRCPECESSGWARTFDHFCVGDAELWPPPKGYQPRRHPHARDFERPLWSRVELRAPTSWRPDESAG